MSSIPEEQVEAARRMNLLTYMQQFEPDNLVRSGNEYRTNSHSSLVISLDGSKWHWFAGGIGGYIALDYLTKVEHVPFREAVQRLTSSPVPVVQDKLGPISVPNETAPAPKVPFKLPPQSRYTDKVLEYLTGRGIARDIVLHCTRQGIIYESYPHHNVVFVGHDHAGTARFASLRGTYQDSHFRMDQPGSDKRYGFQYIPPGCDPNTQRWVAAFEAPIDALSFVTLNRQQHVCPISWERLPVLSLSGTAPAALIQYLHDHPAADTVYLGLDNDAAGQKGVKRITKAIKDDPALSSQVRHIISMLPSPEWGKDYNEVLKKYSAQPESEQARFAQKLESAARQQQKAQGQRPRPPTQRIGEFAR